MPLPSFCGCAGRFQSHLVANPKDRFSRDEAQFKVSQIFKQFYSIKLTCYRCLHKQPLVPSNTVSWTFQEPLIGPFAHLILPQAQLKREVGRLKTKPTKWHLRPGQTQISLGIRPVWSESSITAWKKLGSLAAYWAHSQDSDQPGHQTWRMPRLICVFAGHSHFVGFVMRRLK